MSTYLLHETKLGQYNNTAIKSQDILNKDSSKIFKKTGKIHKR